MFRMSSDAQTMRLAAGEPILFDLQLASASGEVEQLSEGNRRFVFAIYDDTRAAQTYHEALIASDASGEFARWVIDGRESEALLSASGLLWEISERLDNGRDRLAHGTLTIDMSAPRIDDHNGGPVARYITRVVRLFDPSPSLLPTYQVAVLPYTPPIATAGPSPLASMDYSDGANSQYLAMF